VLSLSTSCFGNPNQTTSDILADVGRMGFRAMEYAVSPVRLDPGTVASAVRAGKIIVTSVHALAGLHDGDVNAQGGDLASTDDRLRMATIDGMCDTIDLARRLDAKAVVVHAGGVGGPLEERCRQMMRSWKTWRDTPTLAGELKEIQAARAREAPAFVERTIESLTEVLRRSGEFPLGLETRYVYPQIPLPDELEQIWAEVPGDCLYYWHDVGHARVQQLFGGIPEMSWLTRFGDRLLGVHLHDMVGIRDHMPPGVGELDLAGVAERIRSRDGIRVLEMGSHYVAEAVQAGREHLESLGLM
jgi:sugar phosphate isomerase/epimerase